MPHNAVFHLFECVFASHSIQWKCIEDNLCRAIMDVNLKGVFLFQLFISFLLQKYFTIYVRICEISFLTFHGFIQGSTFLSLYRTLEHVYLMNIIFSFTMFGGIFKNAFSKSCTFFGRKFCSFSAILKRQRIVFFFSIQIFLLVLYKNTFYVQVIF